MTAEPIDRMPTLSLDSAIARIDARMRTLPGEDVAVAEALGRVLAADAVAGADHPPFDRAMIDGLAVRSAETVGASSYSPLARRIGAADGLAANAAAFVKAGERLPAGADSMLPPDYVQPGVAGTVDITETVPPENEIERQASHFTRGAILLHAGRPLRPADLALLAVAGVHRAEVIRRPRIALVVASGAMQAEIEASAAMLRPLLARDGGALAGTRQAEQTPDAIRAACVAADADAVLVLGGPSRGRDRAFAAACAGLLEFTEVALAPGGSVAMASGAARWFSLPAAPVARFWAYEALVGRAIRRLAGYHPAMPFQVLSMPLTRKVVSAIGMTELCLVRRQGNLVEPSAGVSPSNLLALARADGFVIIAEGSEGMPAGAVVPVHLFDRNADTVS